MSGLTGKGSLSIKKQVVQESAITQVGFSKVRALHKCTDGQTVIIMTSLIAPSASEAPNYAAPSPSLLASLDMYAFQNNVEVTSSIRGRLMQNLSYVISGAVTLELRYEAEENEILEIIVDNVARTGNTLVDSRPIVVTGTLLAGSTDFNVGEPFKVGEFPLAQHGVGLVLVDGQPAYRNVGNDPDGEGDYYEVHAGGGLGTLIRFNTPDLVNDRVISFISFGHAERPIGSQLALVEAVQGQIDALVPTVAALAGVPETDFQAQPNNVDLKAFGDRVLALEQEIVTKEDEFSVPYQIRTLPSDISVTTNDIASLRLSNLEVGKTYRLTMQNMAVASDDTSRLSAIHNGTLLLRVENTPPETATNDRGSSSASVIFQAVANLVTFNFEVVSAGVTLEGNGTTAETFVMLEELPQHVVTTQWT